MRRFETDRRLGSGATGTVFQARDRITGATVAVKELNPGVQAPQRELVLARKITHTNVCRLHELYREDGRTLISMEFVDGETLRSLMERSGALPVEPCLQSVRKISGYAEEDPCKKRGSSGGFSRCDRRDRDAGAARDGLERVEQYPMPVGDGSRGTEWAHDAHYSVRGRCFRTIPVDRKAFGRWGSSSLKGCRTS